MFELRLALVRNAEHFRNHSNGQRVSEGCYRLELTAGRRAIKQFCRDGSDARLHTANPSRRERFGSKPAQPGMDRRIGPAVLDGGRAPKRIGQLAPRNFRALTGKGLVVAQHCDNVRISCDQRYRQKEVQLLRRPIAQGVVKKDKDSRDTPGRKG